MLYWHLHSTGFSAINFVLIVVYDCVGDSISPIQSERKLHTRADLRSALTPEVCWTGTKHVAVKLEATENASAEGFSWLSCTCHATAHLCSCD